MPKRSRRSRKAHKSKKRRTGLSPSQRRDLTRRGGSGPGRVPTAPSGRNAAQSPIEMMLQRRQITENEAWAALRFARGYDALTAASAVQATNLARVITDGGDRAPPPQALVLERQLVADLYLEASKQMDLYDVVKGRRPCIAAVMRAVTIGGTGCTELDRALKVTNGWSRQRLAEGLFVLLNLFEDDLTKARTRAQAGRSRPDEVIRRRSSVRGGHEIRRAESSLVFKVWRTGPDGRVLTAQHIVPDPTNRGRQHVQCPATVRMLAIEIRREYNRRYRKQRRTVAA